MKIDLNLFTVFEAIYTEGSLTKAAERLNLTQPAVSHALSRLRDKIDDPLFTRQGHRMRPTAAAQQLFPEIQQALAQLTYAFQTAHHFNPTTTNKTYIIAMRNMIEATLLTPLLKKLEEEAPNIQIASVIMDRKETDAKLASGELDFVVDVLLPTKPDIQSQKLIEDDLIVLANKNYFKAPTMAKEDYNQAKHILVSSRPSGPDLVDYAVNEIDFKRNIALRCQHYFSACQVANNSDFMLTMPRAYGMVLAKQFDNLAVFPMPFKASNFDVYLYWHKNQTDSPVSSWFRSMVESAIGSAD
jgi:DNA-binding transcriptional LysR family regulator